MAYLALTICENVSIYLKNDFFPPTQLENGISLKAYFSQNFFC